ncbi:MAG: type VI secretion system accessory protein TagJ [Acidithiobacillales bacterium]
MPNARDLYQAGHLGAAIEALNGEVRANPTDSSRRIFLFELLAFAGEWDRAEKQLDALGQAGLQATLAVQVYKANIQAERTRSRLFSEGLHPHFLNEPSPYVDRHLDAINRVREGNFAEAREILDKAEEERPALGGTLNGKPFADFRDCDDLIGPVLELIVKDKYAWLPFEQIRRMEISPPSMLRDLVWARAKVEALDGTVGDVYLPALYEGTPKQASDQVRLGRMTEWRALSEELARGAGLKTFLAGEDEVALFEARQVAFERPVSSVAS